VPVLDCQSLSVTFLDYDFDYIKSFSMDYEQPTLFAETPLSSDVLSLQGNTNGYQMETGTAVGSRSPLEVAFTCHGFENSLLDARGAAGKLAVGVPGKFKFQGTACLLACSYAVSAGEFGLQNFRFVFLEEVEHVTPDPVPT
jgi:hypothetical protein